MAKRPLAFGCLALILLLYLACLLSPRKCEDDYGNPSSEVTLTGKIYKKERVRQPSGQVLVLYLKNLSTDEPALKKLVCYLKAGQNEPGIGSRVTLSGKLKPFERATNPGQFDTYSFYQTSGISYRLNQAIILEQSIEYDHMKEGLYRFRCFLSQILSENLPEKESALIKTMLLGEKGDLDRDLKAFYQRNGIAHILAISGLHVSMLGLGLYRLLRKFAVPMKVAAVLAAFALVLYGIMTGFSVSAIRAILMFALHMLAVVTERTYDLLTALAVAAVLLLLEQPLYFYHSGFVFSFGCVLGIALVMPSLTERRKPVSNPMYGKIEAAILSAPGMAVITLPIYLWFYYQFPPYSILLNLLVIPLMSYLMGAGLLVLLLGVLCKPIAAPFAYLISGVFRIYETVCGYSENLPAHLLNLGKPQVWQIVLYLAALLLVVLLRKKVSLLVRWLIMAAAVLILILRPEGSLELTFLDVGQGDCIYINSGNGSRFLIDGGSSSVNSVGEYRLIPFLKYQGTICLKAVFVTHPDEDHCNGVKELLDEGMLHGIHVDCLILPDIGEESREDAYHELELAAERAAVPVQYISAGQQIRAGELTMTCLHPEKGYVTGESNEYSMVLDVSYGNFHALLTGDLEGEGERRLLQSVYDEGKGRLLPDAYDEGEAKLLPDVYGTGEGIGDYRYTVLKVAHHGSAYSTSEEFLRQISPYYAVISCGAGNRYGHPHGETIERLEATGSKILRTDELGAIILTISPSGEVKKEGYRCSVGQGSK